MTEIVIDCSVSATWVLPGELSARAERLLAQVLDGEIRLLVPTQQPYAIGSPPAYDAAYLALADSRGIGLVTADSDLITLRKLYPWIVPLSEY